MSHYPTLIYEDKEMVKRLKALASNITSKENITQLCVYILARELEQVFLVSCNPPINKRFEAIADVVRNSYQRVTDNGENVRLTQDVGKLLQKINSTDIPFDCSVDLRGTVILLRQARA